MPASGHLLSVDSAPRTGGIFRWCSRLGQIRLALTCLSSYPCTIYKTGGCWCTCRPLPRCPRRRQRPPSMPASAASWRLTSWATSRGCGSWRRQSRRTSRPYGAQAAMLQLCCQGHCPWCVQLDESKQGTCFMNMDIAAPAPHKACCKASAEIVR